MYSKIKGASIVYEYASINIYFYQLNRPWRSGFVKRKFCCLYKHAIRFSSKEHL